MRIGVIGAGHCAKYHSGVSASQLCSASPTSSEWRLEGPFDNKAEHAAIPTHHPLLATCGARPVVRPRVVETADPE